MERCKCIDPAENIPAEGFDRIYIGNESCGLFLSSPDFADRINSYAASGQKIGVLLPYLTPERETQLLRLMAHLERPLEIVVNDVGAFRMVQQSKHTPVMGRLLMRQNTDPAIFSFYGHRPDRVVYNGSDIGTLVHVDPSRALTEHFMGSPVFSQETAELFLMGYEKLTVMMDWLPHGMPHKIPGGFRAMLNTEHILVSVLPCENCTGCPKEEILLGKTRNAFPIYRRRNVCYYKRTDVCGTNKGQEMPAYVTRLITM